MRPETDLIPRAEVDTLIVRDDRARVALRLIDGLRPGDLHDLHERHTIWAHEKSVYETALDMALTKEATPSELTPTPAEAEAALHRAITVLVDLHAVAHHLYAADASCVLRADKHLEADPGVAADWTVTALAELRWREGELSSVHQAGDSQRQESI